MQHAHIYKEKKHRQSERHRKKAGSRGATMCTTLLFFVLLLPCMFKNRERERDFIYITKSERV